MKSVLFQTFRVEVESVKFLKLVSIEFLMALRTDSTVLLGGGGGGYARAQLVEALRYKPECRGFGFQ